MHGNVETGRQVLFNFAQWALPPFQHSSPSHTPTCALEDDDVAIDESIAMEELLMTLCFVQEVLQVGSIENWQVPAAPQQFSCV